MYINTYKIAEIKELKFSLIDMIEGKIASIERRSLCYMVFEIFTYIHNDCILHCDTHLILTIIFII